MLGIWTCSRSAAAPKNLLGIPAKNSGISFPFTSFLLHLVCRLGANFAPVLHLSAMPNGEANPRIVALVSVLLSATSNAVQHILLILEKSS